MHAWKLLTNLCALAIRIGTVALCKVPPGRSIEADSFSSGSSGTACRQMTAPQGMVTRRALAGAEKAANAVARRKRKPYSVGVWIMLAGLAAALAVSFIIT